MSCLQVCRPPFFRGENRSRRTRAKATPECDWNLVLSTPSPFYIPCVCSRGSLTPRPPALPPNCTEFLVCSPLSVTCGFAGVPVSEELPWLSRDQTLSNLIPPLPASWCSADYLRLGWLLGNRDGHSPGLPELKEQGPWHESWQDAPDIRRPGAGWGCVD